MSARRGRNQIAPTFGNEPPVVGAIHILYNLKSFRNYPGPVDGRVNRHSRNTFGEGATSAIESDRVGSKYRIRAIESFARTEVTTAPSGLGWRRHG